MHGNRPNGAPPPTPPPPMQSPPTPTAGKCAHGAMNCNGTQCALCGYAWAARARAAGMASAAAAAAGGRPAENGHGGVHTHHAAAAAAHAHAQHQMANGHSNVPNGHAPPNGHPVNGHSVGASSHVVNHQNGQNLQMALARHQDDDALALAAKVDELAGTAAWN